MSVILVIFAIGMMTPAILQAEQKLVLMAEATADTPKPAKDVVAELWQRMKNGELVLNQTSELAFLGNLLHALKIPIESQVLVFSKTSLQKSHISPQTPRAIYYNEDCYIGWVQQGDIEIAAPDSNGTMQYYLVQKPNAENELPVLTKPNQCLSCHVRGGLQIQSVFTRDSGYPMGNEDRYVITYESPLSERWGGWYVTGRHGGDLHMGNVTAIQNQTGLTWTVSKEPMWNHYIRG